MKIWQAKVDWAETYDNDPSLRLLVKDKPHVDDMTYQVKDIGQGRKVYFAEQGGYVSFHLHDKRNQEGYGGHTFHLYTTEGEVDIKGPWSSRSSVMTEYGFTPSIEVSLTEDWNDWQRGHTFIAGAVTIDLLRQYLDDHMPGVALVNEPVYGEMTWRIRRADGKCVKCHGTLFRRTDWPIDGAPHYRDCNHCKGTGVEPAHE